MEIKGEWEEHTTVTRHFVVDRFESKHNFPNHFCAWYLKKELGSEQAVLDHIKEEWELEDLDFTFADLMNPNLYIDDLQDEDGVQIDLADSSFFSDADSEYMIHYCEYMDEKYKTNKFYYKDVPIGHEDCYFIICFNKEGE